MKLAKGFTIDSLAGKTYNAKIIKGYVALYICKNFWILAKGYKLYKYYPEVDKMQFYSKVNDLINGLAASNKFSRRLLRAEITHLYKFGEDWFCIARKGIFKYDNVTKLFELCHKVERGSRPMNLCQDSDGSIYYGEYFYNPERVPVRIFKSSDCGRTWNVAYIFHNGEINHIHGIYQDKFTGNLWVFTGDDDKACIAGYTTDGFKTLHHEFEGKQKFRVCVPLFFKDSIIYPTDSQYCQNYIRKINRDNKSINDLRAIQGSGIYAVDPGDCYLVSTTVEPSEVNTDKSSHLWFSFDGNDWKELCSFKKDILKNSLFQFGSIRFPHFEDPCGYIIATGRAIQKLDQSTIIIPLNQLIQ